MNQKPSDRQNWGEFPLKDLFVWTTTTNRKVQAIVQQLIEILYASKYLIVLETFINKTYYQYYDKLNEFNTSKYFSSGVDSLSSILTFQCTMRAITEVIFASDPKQARIRGKYEEIIFVRTYAYCSNLTCIRQKRYCVITSYDCQILPFKGILPYVIWNILRAIRN